MIDELWIQALNATTFQYTILCVFTLIARKLQVVCWRSRYWMTALLTEMSIFCVRGGCKILIARYTSKCALQSLSDKPLSHIQCILIHKTRKLQVICGHSAYWMTLILSETIFVLFRFVLEIQLEIYGPRHASVTLWYDIVCVYCKPPYIHRYLMWNYTCTCMPDNKTHVPYECILHTKRRLYCQRWTVL